MFEKKVASFINKHNLFPDNGSVIMAVSGGIDSMVLLAFFSKYFNNKQKVYVVHVNHMLRGAQSRADYEFVEQQCQKRQIPFFGTNINIAKKKEALKANGQTVARLYRYRFFKNIMTQLDAKYLLLAHHLDDQAETVIMNLIRGNSFLSYLGIPITRYFATGLLVRPFLGVTRADIFKYASTNNIVFREDRTNNNINYTRNRMRKNIIPLLKQENKQFLSNVSLFSQFEYDKQKYLEKELENYYSDLAINYYDYGFTVCCLQFKGYAIAIQRGLFTLILKRLYKGTSLLHTVKHVESLLELLINEKGTSRVQLAGETYVTKSGGYLCFFYKKNAISEYSMKINTVGETILPNGDIIFAKPINNLEKIPNLELHAIIVSSDSELVVRNKIAGDRILMPSGYGHKKVKKLFLEKRVPVFLRNMWPVILERDEIIWLPYLYKYKFDKDETKKYTCLSYISSTLPHKSELTEKKLF